MLSQALLDSQTKLLSSEGLIEKESSNPPSLLFRVKCFSIIDAPKAIDAIAAPIPGV